MIRRAALNVSLTPQLVAFIAAQVASGRFGTASEVVRAALRSFEQESAERPTQPRTGTIRPSS